MNKDYILDKIDVKAEASNILGPEKGGKFRCYRSEAHKNGDANPSLTMSERGYYKCHSCGVKGDLFQLYMDVNGVTPDRFAEVLLHFSRRYGISTDTKVSLKQRKAPSFKQRKKIGARQAKKTVFAPSKDIFSTKYARGVLDWLKDSYGITENTVRNFGLGWNTSSKRLFIPIPVQDVWEDRKTTTPSDLINVRKHDIMRYHVTWHKYEDGKPVRDESGDPLVEKTRPAEVRRHDGQWYLNGWKPEWDAGRGGKVVGVKGHNSVYLYPMNSFNKEGDIWLVGGELKALLLIQNGINAVCFTCGEQSYAKDMCGFFSGRSVRIVYDIDEAGKLGAMNVGKAIVNAGGDVKIGILPKDGLPSNGDITDYMRLNDWKIDCLNEIKWISVEKDRRETESEPEEKTIRYKQVGFSRTTDGDLLGKYIEFPAIVSGRGTTPFAVPHAANAKCPYGQNNQLPRCQKCSLPKSTFETIQYPKMLRFGGEQVVDLTGLPKAQIEREVKMRLGVPPKCGYPKLKIKYATVERVIVVPTVDIASDESTEYRHQQIYLITDGKTLPKENEEHQIKGKLIGDPRNNAFTLAALETEAIDGNVFSYEYKNVEHEALREALWTDCETSGEVIKRMVGDLRDNILYKYGVDTMITVEMLSWFMPFRFNVGNYKCHKVCPEVLILGDTRVGKSTTARDLAIHFGAGRFVDCGSNPTFVGLVGGNADIGSSKVFTWGVLPTSHRGHVTMDEANKLRLEVWGGLTNLKSDGRAERATNSGTRKTRSNVRFLTLCNPRGNRPLGAYDTPLDAAIEVVGTPQDLARIDLLYVAYGVNDMSILNKFHTSKTKHIYTKDRARYHLKWAWSLNESNIKFASPEHVLQRSAELMSDIGQIRLIAASEAKFKVGRLAVAIASMTYSYHHESGGVIVLNEHIDLAYNLLKKLYSGYLKNAGIKTGVIPKDVKDMFDEVKDFKLLRILSTSDTWTHQDFVEIFGQTGALDFKRAAQLEFGLMTRKRAYFVPVDGFQDLIRDYVNKRS